jgi:hypothetical protein
MGQFAKSGHPVPKSLFEFKFRFFFKKLKNSRAKTLPSIKLKQDLFFSLREQHFWGKTLQVDVWSTFVKQLSNLVYTRSELFCFEAQSLMPLNPH